MKLNFYFCISISARYSSQLPDKVKLEDLLEHKCKLIVKDPSLAKDVDVCGTVLPNEPTISAEPNSRQYILRPIEESMVPNAHQMEYYS